MKKKNGGLVWYIIAGVFAVSGLYALASGTEGGFVTLIVAAILAFVGYRKAASAKKAAEEARKKAEALAEGQRIFEQKHGIIACSVSGVTFDNDDGTSRQRVLRSLLNDPDNDSFDVTFVPYEYKKKPALYVMYEGKCVGNVPADYVEDIVPVIDRIEIATITPDKFKDDDGKTIYRADLRVQYAK